MRHQIKSCFAACWLVACSGGAGFGSSDRSSDKDDDKEEEPIAIPEEVAGSFLTMECD